MPEETIPKETLENYQDGSNLSTDEKFELRKEFHASNGSKSVLRKAVKMNGGKAQHKGNRTSHTK